MAVVGEMASLLDVSARYVVVHLALITIRYDVPGLDEIRLRREEIKHRSLELTGSEETHKRQAAARRRGNAGGRLSRGVFLDLWPRLFLPLLTRCRDRPSPVRRYDAQ